MRSVHVGASRGCSRPGHRSSSAPRAAGGREAVTLIDRLAPELVFLDVQMPDLDGFGVLRELARPPRYVVFTTAYDRFALEAFAVGALDYLLKPFGERELARAIARAVEREAETRFQEGYHRLLAALERPRHLDILRSPTCRTSCSCRSARLSASRRTAGSRSTARTGGKSYSTELPSRSSSSASTRRSSAPTAGRLSASASCSASSPRRAVATAVLGRGARRGLAERLAEAARAARD